jgi:hypothetical protein
MGKFCGLFDLLWAIAGALQLEITQAVMQFEAQKSESSALNYFKAF